MHLIAWVVPRTPRKRRVHNDHAFQNCIEYNENTHTNISRMTICHRPYADSVAPDKPVQSGVRAIVFADKSM